jgi:hypothetical protein
MRKMVDQAGIFGNTVLFGPKRSSVSSSGLPQR